MRVLGFGLDNAFIIEDKVDEEEKKMKKEIEEVKKDFNFYLGYWCGIIIVIEALIGKFILHTPGLDSIGEMCGIVAIGFYFTQTAINSHRFKKLELMNK
jgi:hypothetical protein